MANKISWLFLLTVFLTFVSCRNDLVPEQDMNHNNSSKFQLTPKRISLNEAKHKSFLLPELEKAEAAFKNSKTYVNGRVINYGNGVSIDTDDVIYIENGPNYHTYTFHIKRENAPADAPVENLVLTLLPDGSYREFLVSYQFTEQEKQNILMGIPVDTKGKTIITEPVQGTYNGNGQLARSVCGYVEETIWVSCYTGDHNQSNWQTWHECNWEANGGTPPMVYTVFTYKCIEEEDDTIDPSDGGSGGGGSGGSGGSGTTTPPCTTPAIPTVPQTGFTDPNGCPIGIPTLPNLGGNPKETDPCAKTKNMLARPNVQAGITTVKSQAVTTISDVYAGETGFKEKKDGTIAPADVTNSHKVIYNDVTDGKGGYHNHTATGTHMFSPPDIVDTLLGFAAGQDNVSDAYFGMIAAEWCSTCPNHAQFTHYVIQYTGAAADIGNGGIYNFTQAQVNQFIYDYLSIVKDLTNKSLNGTTYIKNGAGDLNEKGLEKLFFETLKVMGMNGKVNLQRIEPGGTIYNVTLDNNNMPVGIPCPN